MSKRHLLQQQAQGLAALGHGPRLPRLSRVEQHLGVYLRGQSFRLQLGQPLGDGGQARPGVGGGEQAVADQIGELVAALP